MGKDKAINEIYANFKKLAHTPSDINEHMEALNRYASECEHITEMGVRNVVSTWAFLMAQPKKLVCYDIHKQKEVDHALWAAKESGIKMEFHEKDVLKVEIEETDLLFIDTLHTYSQIKKELALHGNKSRKYIIFHDVVTYGHKPEPASWQTPEIMKNYVQNDKGIMPAIEEFIDENDWKVKEFFTNNNGLLIIERMQ